MNIAVMTSSWVLVWCFKASSSNDASIWFGVASDVIPETTSIETVEYEGWLVFEEEPRATIDWNTHTKPSNVAAISEISPIQQTNCTPISFEDLPFYATQAQPSTSHLKGQTSSCFDQSQHALSKGLVDLLSLPLELAISSYALHTAPILTYKMHSTFQMQLSASFLSAPSHVITRQLHILMKMLAGSLINPPMQSLCMGTYSQIRNYTLSI